MHIQNKTASGIKKRIQPQSQNKKRLTADKKPKSLPSWRHSKEMKGFPLNIPPNAKRLRLTFGCQSSSLSDSLHSRFQIFLNTHFSRVWPLFYSLITRNWPLNWTELKRFPVTGSLFHCLISGFESSQSKGSRLGTPPPTYSKVFFFFFLVFFNSFQPFSFGMYGSFWAVDSEKIQLAS